MNQRYSESQQEAAQIARVALPWISRHDLSACPTNYAVAYEYLSRRNPALCDAADQALQDADRATQELIDDLYRRFISGEHTEEVLASVRNELSRLFAEALTAVSSGGDGMERYKRRLQHASERLSSRVDLSAVRGVISEMIAETRRMQESSEQLQTHLQSTCDELESLRFEFQQVQHEAVRDALTGLLNRRGLDRALEELVTQDLGFAALMLDVDHFKRFNDKHGHVVGDEVLRYVARVIGDNIKGGDMAGRYGGEEFMVLLPRTRLEHGQRVAEHIATAIRRAELTQKSTGRRLDAVTVSIGAAAYREGEAASDTIARADAALYRAKAAGRDRIVASPE